MAKIIRFPGNPEDNPTDREIQDKAMMDGRFYDLNPPIEINKELYDRVQCEYQVPSQPNEYAGKGVPRGGTEIKSMVLKFTATRGTQITEFEDQDFSQSTPDKSA